MTYWDGNRWIPEGPPQPREPRRRAGRRLLGASTEAALITLLMFGLIAGTTLAAKGGNGNSPHRTMSTCTVNGNGVTGTALPTDQVLNFMVTEDGYTWGWVLGFAGDDGTWGVPVPDRSGPTTYEFASRTWGPNGTKYTVFSSCSTSG
jgi:hypothetical protein